ncbi:MAG TPA: S-layer homology domain-containing protein, partial [Candidatus Diapherotrites archaeon]|nr:S-layer homology domain-containing protein [Candidatus Diapherotrites archaeon]
NYLEQGTDEPVATAKTAIDQTFGEEVTEYAIDVEGYNKVDPTTKSIVLGVSGNVINFYYSINSYKLTINYQHEDGTAAAATHEETLANGEAYSVTSPEITGYTPDQAVVAGVMGTSDVTVTVTYTARTDIAYTVNYLEQGTDKVLKEAKVVGNKTIGEEVTEWADYIEGYSCLEYNKTLVLAASGNVINFYYTANEYYVTYEPGSGSGTMTDESNPYIFREEVTVLGNGFTAPEGYHFTHWQASGGEQLEAYDAGEGNEVPVFDVERNYYPGDKFLMPSYDVTLTAQWAQNTYTITFAAGNNGSLSGTASFSGIVHGTKWGEAGLTVPTPIANSGYRFSSWTPLLPASDTAITGNLTFTANFTRISDRDDDDDDDRDRDRGRDRDVPETIEIIPEEIPLAAPQLNKTDHYQYLQGYPDNTIRPEGYITKEEAAAVFYRLLAPDYRVSIMTFDHKFTDVQTDRWSLKYIATLANGGIIEGNPDGTFQPQKPITKAELAALASRFDNLSPFSDDRFSDIAGHWANKYINSAAVKGWVKGNPDGTFEPDKPITRAEFATLVNNVLERRVRKDKILPDARRFPDLSESEWYYEAMQEAINSHYYIRLEDTYEEWTEIYFPDLEM